MSNVRFTLSYSDLNSDVSVSQRACVLLQLARQKLHRLQNQSPKGRYMVTHFLETHMQHDVVLMCTERVTNDCNQ